MIRHDLLSHVQVPDKCPEKPIKQLEVCRFCSATPKCSVCKVVQNTASYIRVLICESLVTLSALTSFEKC